MNFFEWAEFIYRTIVGIIEWVNFFHQIATELFQQFEPGNIICMAKQFVSIENGTILFLVFIFFLFGMRLLKLFLKILEFLMVIIKSLPPRFIDDAIPAKILSPEILKLYRSKLSREKKTLF